MNIFLFFLFLPSHGKSRYSVGSQSYIRTSRILLPAFDCDITWESDLEATVRVSLAGGLARVPITIRNVRLQGVVRVIFTPMIPASPGFGATLISLVNKPTIGLDVKVAGGEVTRVPRLRAELLKSIQQTVSDNLLWPKRVVVPSLGVSDRPVLSRNVLKALEKTDPLLEAEEALGTRPMLRRKMDTIMDDLERDEDSDEEKLKAVGLIPTPSFQEHRSKNHVDALQNGVLWENLAVLKAYIDRADKGAQNSKTQQQNGMMWAHWMSDLKEQVGHNGHRQHKVQNKSSSSSLSLSKANKAKEHGRQHTTVV
jgi:hypothetical protein